VGSAGGAGLWLKAEWLNPGGSVKDRAARAILREGLRLGMLPGKRLLDASSGNTAIAYAMLGAAAAVNVTVCVPANASRERLTLLRLYGAEVVLTDPMDGTDGAIRRAEELAAEDPERYWYADQYNNPANPRAHWETTGAEIWWQTAGRITHFVAGLGTTGTMMGAGGFLKAKHPRVRLVAVQPDSPLHGLEGLKHLASTAHVPGFYDPALVDRVITVPTEAADAAARALARESGYLVGWSTGAAIHAAREILGSSSTAFVVAIGSDSGTRYLSEPHRWAVLP
jgi:cysteine synthase B